MRDSIGRYQVVTIDINDLTQQISRLFLRAYQIEARLIGAENFPPLKRSADSLIEDGNSFMGVIDNDEIIGAVEYELSNGLLDVVSLAVDPLHLRKGIANSLLRHLMASIHWQQATVQTAASNTPAIRLYQQFGFTEMGRIETPEDIKVITFQLEN